MNLKDAAGRVGSWVKKHPALSAAIVFTVVAATLYLTRRRGGTATTTGGEYPYTMVMGGGDSAAALQAKAYETQAGVARYQIEQEAKLMEQKIAGERELAALQMTTAKDILSMQLAATAAAKQSEFDLAKYMIDAQYNPSTYATMEIEEMYAAYGREPTRRDIDYWKGQFAAGGNASTILQNELAKDQVVLANKGVTKTEANQISQLYAKQGRTPTQEDLLYWGNYSGNMEAALAYQLQVDSGRMLN